MKAFYKVNNNQILLDFERPILQINLPNFLVNDTLQIASPGPTSDSLWVNCPSFPSLLDDIDLEFKTGTLLYLTGPAADRIVKPFLISVVLHSFNPETQAVANTLVIPSVGDFIEAFGYEEAVSITNPENALATSPNEYKLIRALEDAEALFNSYVANEPAAKNVIVFPGKRRAILNFARYFLDTRCRRQNVTDDYLRSIKELKIFNEAAVVVPVIDTTVYYNGDEIAYGSVTPCNSCSSECQAQVFPFKGNW
jgi:phage gp36-like protein